MTADIDRWIADAAVRSSHRRESSARPAALWRAAAAVRLRDSRLLGRLVALRIAGVEPDSTFASMFRAPPFVLLEDGELHAFSGLCGRIWAIRGELGALASPEEFTRWREPGTVRVLFAHWVSEREGGGSAIHSEVRVAPVDRRAALYMRALEPFIAACQGLVGREALTLAVRRAER